LKKFKELFGLAANYKLNLVANLVFNILASVLSLFTFLAVVPFLRILFSDGNNELELPEQQGMFDGDYWYQYFSYQLDLYIAENGAMSALVYMCLSIVLLAFLKNLVHYAALYSIASIRTGVARDLRSMIYNKLLRLPLSYYSNERKGDVLSRMSNDLMEVEFSVIGAVEVIFKSPVMLLLSLVTLFVINTQLTLFALIFLPLSGFLISRIAKSLKNAAGRGKTRLGELISTVEETLSGMRIVKAFNAEVQFSDRFEGINNSYFRLMRKLYKREYLSSPMSEFISLLVISVLLFVGGSMILSADTAMGGDLFIGYLVVFSQIIPPAKAITDAFFKINKGGASMERINEILDAPDRIFDVENAQPITGFNESIELKNVRFSYTQDQEILKGINLKINKGETVALVGPSGGGKSTLANLVARFYDVDEGQVLFDGVDIKAAKMKDLRAQMGIVTQDSILFNDSVTNNIALGAAKGSLDADKVRQAAKIANAEEFILKLDGQFDFNVGDAGGKLSGGQKQRVSIARAVYKNPPVLILDEATSALDTESEKLVQEAIEKLMKNRTSLVIAHRLSTIQNADKIVVVQGGVIAEEGNHAALMEKRGIYAKLVEMQAFE
jgi:subfamily B ATP-binding cassette protein MsbA